MRPRFSLRYALLGRDEILQAKRQWKTYRPPASSYFDTDLSSVRLLLPVVPYMGVEVVSPDGFRVHRIVQRTGYLLFYEVQEQSRVVKLLRLWDPRRGDVEGFFFE
ncbi:MAG: type II toxin-antitoxin system RelE/ParE family toxin [Myxococcales bacterium]|nr:type II toxin-antitoxin system RelE/ParE family toxin [Myxococcales bacterium]